MRRDDEKGVALLTVLLLVAVMSVMAAGVLEEIRLAVRRAANAEAVGQARWYALGAEAFARDQIGRLPDVVLTSGEWSGRAADLPLDGGAMRARISDGADCFNLNSVVAGPPERLQRNGAGVAQFTALAEGLGFPRAEAESLAAALVDWIDGDPLREAGGAEDEAYEAGGQGYLTGATLLAEASELRAIRGFTPAVYARLRPYVCALPTAELSPININTLRPEKARLVAMLAEQPMTEAQARRVLAARPPGGWPGVADFLSHPAFEAAPLRGEAARQLTVRPRYFRLETEVTYGDAEVVSTATLERAGGVVRLVARRWGPEE